MKYFALALFFLPVSVMAWTPFVADVTQQESAEHRKLDHLEPLNVRKADDIPEQWYYLAQYNTFPSFSPSTHLVVYKKSGEYFIKTWEELRSNGGKNEIEPQRVEFKIPKTTAALVYEIWTNALFETRYSRASSMGLDGTTYVFSTFVLGLGWLHGETWSPDADLPPKWMVETGDYLVDFSRRQNKDFARCDADLQRFRDRLFAYLNKQGKH